MTHQAWALASFLLLAEAVVALQFPAAPLIAVVLLHAALVGVGAFLVVRLGARDRAGTLLVIVGAVLSIVSLSRGFSISRGPAAAAERSVLEKAADEVRGRFSLFLSEERARAAALPSTLWETGASRDRIF